MVWVGSNVDEGGGTKPLSEAQKTLWIPGTAKIAAVIFSQSLTHWKYYLTGTKGVHVI